MTEPNEPATTPEMGAGARARTKKKRIYGFIAVVVFVAVWCGGR